MRPRSETSMPCDLAHSRTSLVFELLEDEPEPDRRVRRAPPATLRLVVARLEAALERAG